MTLPDFDGRGVLPPTEHGEPHLADSSEVEQRFVVDRDSQEWRIRLMRGWHETSQAIWEDCPGAYWWLWGTFVTQHLEPRFGDRETLTCAVFLPDDDLSALSLPRRNQLIWYIQDAERRLGVDVSWVLDLPPDDEDYLEQRMAAEKYRDRARRSPIEDDEMPVGFVEVRR